jgi:hypothetical protein
MLLKPAAALHEKSVLSTVGEANKGKPNVAEVHYRYAMISSLDGKIRTVLLTVLR